MESMLMTYVGTDEIHIVLNTYVVIWICLSGNDWQIHTPGKKSTYYFKGQLHDCLMFVSNNQSTFTN